MIFQERIEAILTNLAYVLAGFWMLSVGVVAPAVSSFILGPLSGIHHYYLEDWSRKLDYFGMYVQAIATSFWLLGMATVPNIIMTLGLGIILYFGLGSSVRATVALIGATLIIFGVLHGLFPLMAILTILAYSYTFNYLGDNVHKEKHHSPLHGIPWHIGTAFAIMLLISIAL